MNQKRMYQRILVGVDAGGLAVHAVALGYELHSKLGAELDLVHAVDVPPPVALWPGVDARMIAEVRSTAMIHARERVVAALAEHDAEGKLASLPVAEHLHVAPGNPAEVLLERVRETGADLLIVGPHAKRAMFDFGSTARAMLSRTPAPVWVQHGPPQPIRHILAPIDFSEHSRVALEHAHALAMRLGASIEVLHAYAPPDFAYTTANDPLPGVDYVVQNERKAAVDTLRKWVDDFDWQAVQAKSTFLDGTTVETVTEAAKHADLVVLGTHGHTGLTRFLLGSVAYGVLKRAEKPVLVVPLEDRAWILHGHEHPHSGG